MVTQGLNYIAEKVKDTFPGINILVNNEKKNVFKNSLQYNCLYKFIRLSSISRTSNNEIGNMVDATCFIQNIIVNVNN